MKKWKVEFTGQHFDCNSYDSARSGAGALLGAGVGGFPRTPSEPPPPVPPVQPKARTRRKT